MTSGKTDPPRKRPDPPRDRLNRLVHDCADEMIAQARTGEHPEVALQLLSYFIGRVFAKEPIDHRVSTYVAEALKEAVHRHAAGTSIAATETFIVLGLVRPRGGRPRGSGGKFTESAIVQMKQEIAHMLAAGEKHVTIQTRLAEEYDCDEDTVREKLREVNRRAVSAVSEGDRSRHDKDSFPGPDDFVGNWLDPVDQFAGELGVERAIVEAIARRAPPFPATSRGKTK